MNDQVSLGMTRLKIAAVEDTFSKRFHYVQCALGWQEVLLRKVGSGQLRNSQSSNYINTKTSVSEDNLYSQKDVFMNVHDAVIMMCCNPLDDQKFASDRNITCE